MTILIRSAFLAAVALLVAGQSGPNCSITNAVLEEGVVYTLTSINFPQAYPSVSQSCVFTATAPANTQVMMYCDVFDMLFNNGCDYARMTFSPTGDPTFSDGIYDCGQHDSVVLFSTTNKFAMKFENQWTNVYSQAGFRCHVVAFAQQTTQAPTTQPPTTQAPTTQAPTTQAPTTQAPTTQPPTTQPPTTQPPTTQPPTTQPPTTQAPTTQAPTTQAPTTQAPTTQPPTTQPPTTQPPTTQPPTTQPPTTQPPTTQPPTTQPPTTQPPTTQPPTTQPPTTQPPTTQPPTTQPPTTQPPTTQPPTTQPPTTQPPTTQPPSTCSCGVKSVVSRIVGGVEAQVNEYPWMAALRFKSTNAQYCGGALISDQWVITATHCLDINIQPADISVTLGGHYRDLTNDVSSSTTYDVLQIVSHEGYDDVTIDNDIGLVKLATPVAFTATVSPICLPFPFPTADFHGVTATVTGWGTTSYQGASSTTLHEVQLPVLANAQCKSGFNLQANLTENMFCTFAHNKDSCQGDSGGPLQYEFEGRNYLIGTVSWGIECASPDNPGVYAKVNNYLGWIKQKTGETFCGEV